MQVATPETWYETRRLDDGVTYIGEPFIKEFYRLQYLARARPRAGPPGGQRHGRGQPAPAGAPGHGKALRRRGKPHPLRPHRLPLRVRGALGAPRRGRHHGGAGPGQTFADKYVSDEIFTRLPPQPYVSAQYDVKAAPATRLLEEGDVVDLGDRHFEILHTPGHSPGGIMLFERASGILISGDTIYDGPADR